MKIITLTLTLIICAFTLYAQDTVTTIRGERLLLNIKSKNTFEVFYVKPKYPREKPHALSLSEIASIAYADGRADTFFLMDGKKISAKSPLLKSDSLVKLGRKDALKYYSRCNNAATGTLLATFPGSPLAGLITACATASTPPKERYMDFPNDALAAKEPYRTAYEAKAWQIKRKRVWGAYGFGLIATAAGYAFFQLLRH